MPTVWNASPYDLTDGAGTTILSNTTVTVPTSDYVTAAILAGLLVIADGNHAVTKGLGNPAQTQTAPALALMAPTAADATRIPAGSDLPVDASKAARSPLLPPAKVGAVCGYSKVDNSSHAVDPAPHGDDVLIPSTLATLATPQTAVRLFGYTGGWVVVPYNPDAVTGLAEFTQLATMQAGQTVSGGQSVDTQQVSGKQTVRGGQSVSGGSSVTGGQQVIGGSKVSGGQTVTNGQAVTGGQTVDTLTATGLVVARAGVQIAGGLTADTATVAGWHAYVDALSHPSWTAPGGGVGIVSVPAVAGSAPIPATLYVVLDSDTTKHAALTALVLTSDTTVNGVTVNASNTVNAGGWNVNRVSGTTGYPQIVATEADVGLVAFQGRLYSSNPANDAARDFNAGVYYGNAIQAAAAPSSLANLVVANQLNVNGPGYANGFNTSSLQVGAAGAPADRQITTNDLTANNNIWAKNQVLQGANHTAVTSERRFKNHRRYVRNGLDVYRALRPAIYTWRDKRRGEGLYVGVYLDELRDVAPEAVRPRGRPEDIPGEGLTPEEKRFLTEGDTYDDRGLLAYGVDAVQTLDRQIQAQQKEIRRLRRDNTTLRARTTELTARLDGLAARVDRLAAASEKASPLRERTP